VLKVILSGHFAVSGGHFCALFDFHNKIATVPTEIIKAIIANNKTIFWIDKLKKLLNIPLPPPPFPEPASDPELPIPADEPVFLLPEMKSMCYPNNVTIYYEYKKKRIGIVFREIICIQCIRYEL
jgi:hypothetical protein